MKEEIIKLILERLSIEKEQIKQDFNSDRGLPTRFTAIDNLLPNDLAMKIYNSFPKPENMRLLDSFRERKFTSKALDKFDSLISDITFAFQDSRVIKLVEEITTLTETIGDPKLYAGGISSMQKGHFLNPHIDNSHDSEQKNYRVLNLLYYVTPDWKAENGGNLELWDANVTKPVEIPSLFNRLVLMATNDKSFHSVNEIRSDGVRSCVSNYYFSPISPNGYETTHVTFFKARPEQKIRRVLTDIDGHLRTFVRKIKKEGFSKTDVFEKLEK
jgi:Rps23 Pro-64 3,4-dihydroxylase Tpa1-like proline 4-hydroxylase